MKEGKGEQWGAKGRKLEPEDDLVLKKASLKL
jgi:hypothetical protein